MSMRLAMAAAAIAGGLGFATAPVSAAPLPHMAAVAPLISANDAVVEKATFYRNRGWRSRGYGYGSYRSYPRYGGYGSYGSYGGNRGYGAYGGYGSYRGNGYRW